MLTGMWYKGKHDDHKARASFDIRAYGSASLICHDSRFLRGICPKLPTRSPSPVRALSQHPAPPGPDHRLNELHDGSCCVIQHLKPESCTRAVACTSESSRRPAQIRDSAFPMQQSRAGAREHLLLTRPRVMQMLLVQAPRFENHGTRRRATRRFYRLNYP